MTFGCDHFTFSDNLITYGTNFISCVTFFCAGCLCCTTYFRLVTSCLDYFTFFDGLTAYGTNFISCIAILSTGCFYCSLHFCLMFQCLDGFTLCNDFTAVNTYFISGITFLCAGWLFCINHNSGSMVTYNTFFFDCYKVNHISDFYRGTSICHSGKCNGRTCCRCRIYISFIGNFCHMLVVDAFQRRVHDIVISTDF